MFSCIARHLLSSQRSTTADCLTSTLLACDGLPSTRCAAFVHATPLARLLSSLFAPMRRWYCGDSRCRWFQMHVCASFRFRCPRRCLCRGIPLFGRRPQPPRTIESIAVRPLRRPVAAAGEYTCGGAALRRSSCIQAGSTRAVPAPGGRPFAPRRCTARGAVRAGGVCARARCPRALTAWLHASPSLCVCPRRVVRRRRVCACSRLLLASAARVL